MKTLRWSLAAGLGLGLLSWITVWSADEQKPAEKEIPKVEVRHTIELKYAPGEKISVEKKDSQNMNINGKMKMIIHIGEGKEQTQNMDLNMDMTNAGTVKYEEEILEVSEKGEVNKLQREYLKHETKGKTKQSMSIGGNDQEIPSQEETKESPLSGKTIILERDGKEIKVKIKGSKEKLKEEIEKSLKIDDPIKKLLPKEPVKIGDKWTIDPNEGPKIFGTGEDNIEKMKLMKFLDFSGECTLKEVSQNGQTENARISIKGTMKCEVDDLKSILGGKGHKDSSEDSSDNPMKSINGSMTMTMKFSGELLFDIKEGRPLLLEASMDEIKGTMEGEGTVKQEVFSMDMEMKMKIKGDGKKGITYKYGKEK
ncbi:MAG: hypothetical protein V1709_08115 [Planctomycetota bacterium]